MIASEHCRCTLKTLLNRSMPHKPDTQSNGLANIKMQYRIRRAVYITPPWGGFPSSIARQPRGYQYLTLRLRKDLLGEMLPTPTFLAPAPLQLWRCRPWKIGPGGAGVIYTVRRTWCTLRIGRNFIGYYSSFSFAIGEGFPPTVTLHATRPTPQGASQSLVLAMPAWLMKTRRAPSRHCRDASVYRHTTRAGHAWHEYPPPLSEK